MLINDLSAYNLTSINVYYSPLSFAILKIIISSGDLLVWAPTCTHESYQPTTTMVIS